MHNLYLIGYRATGKTAVSALLGNKMGRQVIHTDEEIIKRYGRIDSLVERGGWEEFRRIESDILIEASKHDTVIVDCGGGIVTKEENICLMKGTGIVVWLTASVRNIRERMKNCKKDLRPPLSKGSDACAEVEEILKARKPLYKKAADIMVETDILPAEEIADKIIEIYNEHMHTHSC